MENYLQEELMLDIFSRLPAESVLCCRQVCKTWRNLPVLTDANFISMHLNHQLHDVGDEPGSNLLRFSDSSTSTYDYYQVFFGGYPYNGLKKIYNSIPNGSYIVGSCNGVVCFSQPHKSGPRFSICNLLTREYIHLPKGPELNMQKSLYSIISGFGYHRSTNEYKVVQITCYCSDGLESHLDVYSLGSGQWRNKGVIPYAFYPRASTFANEALYFRDHYNPRRIIYALDLKNEEFNILPTHLNFEYRGFGLGVLDGWLCGIERKSESMDLWLFKKKKMDNNTNIKAINQGVKENKYLHWSWIRECSIPKTILSDFTFFQPLTLTRSRELVFYGVNGPKYLYSYDPKNGKCERLLKLGLDQIVLHMNSFVSLAALGENSVQEQE